MNLAGIKTMKNIKLKEIIAKEIAKKATVEYRKVKRNFNWDKVSPEIDEIVFKDNFHLIVKFKDGTIKDIDAKVFMNHKQLKSYFDELRNNIELFQNPKIVSDVGIIWTDMADISAKGLWEWGKVIEDTKVATQKIAMPKLKTFSKGVSLVKLSDEKKHSIPHFHLYKGDSRVGSISINTPDSKIDKCNKEYKDVFKEIQNYVQNNKGLLTQIYRTNDSNKINELTKNLP